MVSKTAVVFIIRQSNFADNTLCKFLPKEEIAVGLFYSASACAALHIVKAVGYVIHNIHNQEQQLEDQKNYKRNEQCDSDSIKIAELKRKEDIVKSEHKFNYCCRFGRKDKQSEKN